METMLVLGLGLILLGVLLVVIEAFVPSGGIIGLMAAVSAIAGVVMLFRHDTMWGVTGLLLVIVLGPMLFIWSIKLLPHTPLGKSIVGDTGEEIAAKRDLEASRWRETRNSLVDREGEALTDLIPVGVVRIDGQRHDAVAHGEMIDRGTRVRVVGVDGLQIRVRPVRS